ncbi:hypothetical protein PSAR109036_01860 [Psychrobacter arenosus]|uniref:DUF7302 family protein n=1 Tax=Psychrobacter arenosus TaxID=256326 RepID=UPI00191B1DE1|nr:hypothetical protein [Psychrobacter arenosus]
MKVKFLDVMCMGNKTHAAGSIVEVPDLSAQQLIERGDAELIDDSSTEDDKTKAAKGKAAASIANPDK